jgi:hypothetical protein
MVGTPRCGVTARKARGKVHGTTSNYARCAATRGADSVARRPYRAIFPFSLSLFSSFLPGWLNKIKRRQSG